LQKKNIKSCSVDGLVVTADGEEHAFKFEACGYSVGGNLQTQFCSSRIVDNNVAYVILQQAQSIPAEILFKEHSEK
jgi:hypothetical protein